MTSKQRSILAVATLTQGVAIGLSYGIFPLFLQPIELAFAASRSVVSSGLIVLTIALALGGVVVGTAFDRGYARGVMLFGAALLSCSLVIASLATHLWILGLAAGMLGFSVPAIGPLAGGSLITRFFNEERGLALGWMSMGPPLGSGLFAGIAGFSMIYLDWRQVFLLLSVIALALTVPIIWYSIPARMEVAEPALEAGGGMGDVLRVRSFWWVGGIYAIASGVVIGWVTHMAAFLADVGLDPAQQSALLAVQFWMGVPGAILFGILADRFRLATLFFIMLGAQAVIFFVFAANISPIVVAVLGISFGFFFGGLMPLFMMLLGQKMGADLLGRAMALSNLLMLPVMAATVVLAARVHEEDGQYQRALLVLGFGMLAGVICAWRATKSPDAA